MTAYIAGFSPAMQASLAIDSEDAASAKALQMSATGGQSGTAMRQAIGQHKSIVTIKAKALSNS